jgi:hypothetical protein
MPIEQPTEFELLNQSEDRKTSSLGYTPIFNRHRRRGDRIDAHLLRCICRFVAQMRSAAMFDMSPLLGAERT